MRAVIEGQQMAMALHSRWMNVKVDSIHATGGAAANRDILQVMADVFGAVVYQLQVGNSAALGAALQAFHGAASAEGQPMSWDELGERICRAARRQRAAARPRPSWGLIRSVEV